MVGQNYLEKKISPHACLRVNITILFSGGFSLIGNLPRPLRARAVKRNAIQENDLKFSETALSFAVEVNLSTFYCIFFAKLRRELRTRRAFDRCGYLG